MGPQPAVAEVRRACGPRSPAATSDSTGGYWWPAQEVRTRWLSPRRRSSKRRAPACRPGSSPSTIRLWPGSLEQARARRVDRLRARLRPGRGGSGRRRNGRRSGGGGSRGTVRGPRRRRRGARRDRAARPYSRRPGRDGAARPGPRIRPAQRRRDASGRRTLPPPLPRSSASDDSGGLPSPGAHAVGRPGQPRYRASSGSGCARRCCHFSSRCCKAAWPRPWLAPPRSRSPTSTRSTPWPSPTCPRPARTSWPRSWPIAPRLSARGYCGAG